MASALVSGADVSKVIALRKRMAKEFKRVRESRGWSQADVARFVGLHRNTYSTYETAATEPPFSVGLELCKLFSIEIKTLLRAEEGDSE